MADLPLLDRDTILRVVRSWPPDEQRALAGDILRHTGAPLVEEPLAPPDSAGLAGLLATKDSPPTDEDVANWLDVHRLERYGH